MANLVHKRVSTDQQSTARQNLVLDEAGIEDPIPFEEEAGTSSTPAGLWCLSWDDAGRLECSGTVAGQGRSLRDRPSIVRQRRW
ncbi:hypothetical protein GCM10010446_30970 [Streptomyces enissocaesilis]|uniref:Uncharacterized protein n=1 Tax=Streptomyces enissocaesilis TaxID=332589 RepID=A0ABP6JTE2_9ACTN